MRKKGGLSDMDVMLPDPKSALPMVIKNGRLKINAQEMHIIRSTSAGMIVENI